MHTASIERTYRDYRGIERPITYDIGYVVVMEAVGEYQVVRYLQFKNRYYKKKPDLHTYNGEVQQVWIAPNGNIGVYKKYYLMCHNWLAQPYSLWSGMRWLKNSNYDSIRHDYIAWRSTSKALQLRGLRKSLHGCGNPVCLCSGLLKSSACEFMWKCGYRDLLSIMIKRYNEVDNTIYTAVKIANRNHYKIEDAGLWIDMIYALDFVGRDIHNAHYVCPDNLREAHDKAIKERHNKQMRDYENARKLRMLEELEREKKDRDLFMKRMEFAKNIGVFVSKHLDYTILRTPEELVDEGNAMHHCVGGYWRSSHPKAMIISIRDIKTKERVSTMEVTIGTWEIVQNRGVCNYEPKYDNEARSTILSCKDRFDAIYKSHINKNSRKQNNTNSNAVKEAA